VANHFVELDNLGDEFDLGNVTADTLTVVDASDTLRGLVNNTSLQELGGVDKAINGVRTGRGPGNNAGTTVLGNLALGTNASFTALVAIGAQAARNTVASVFGVYIGNNAADSASVFADNTIVGRSAAQNIVMTAGGANTIVGGSAGQAATNCTRNTFMGASAALRANGFDIVAIGSGAFFAGTQSKSRSVAVGANAGDSAIGQSMTLVGTQAAARGGALRMVAIGDSAALAASGQGSAYLGFNAGSAFVAGAAQAVTAIDPVTNQITVPAHGLGAPGNTISLEVGGTAPGGLTFGQTYVFSIISINTLESAADITTAVAGMTVAPNTVNSFANSVALGQNTNTTTANQIQLGNATVAEVRTSGAYFGTAFNVVSDDRNKKYQDLDLKAAAELSRAVDWRVFMKLSSFADVALNEAINAGQEKAHARALARAAVRKKERQELKGKGLKTEDADSADVQQAPVASEAHPTTQREIGMQAGVSAQSLRKITAKIGAFEWLVNESFGGELSVDYTSLYAIVAAGVRFRLQEAGI
jgi:hypothetical protein